MKKLSAIFALLLSFSAGVMAQSNATDPSYSVHNYKHPNKAEYARKNNLDQLQTFDYIEEEKSESQLGSARDYKHQRSGKQTGGVIPTQNVEKDKNTFFSKRNYKHQF